MQTIRPMQPIHDHFLRIPIDAQDDQSRLSSQRVQPAASAFSTIRQSAWWCSLVVHGLLICWIGLHGMASPPADKAPDTLRATLIQMPQPIEAASPPAVPIHTQPEAQPEAQPKAQPEADTATVTQATPPAVSERASPPELAPTATPPSQTTPAVAVPTFDFRQQQPLLLKSESAVQDQATEGFSILSQQTLLGLATAEQQAIAAAGTESFAQYTKAQISPTLVAGPAPLSKEAQFIKTYMQAKIDIDCASGLNQALVIISSFTVGALLCEDKGNVDEFIQQRLAEKKPPPPLRGMAQLKAIAHDEQ